MKEKNTRKIRVKTYLVLGQFLSLVQSGQKVNQKKTFLFFSLLFSIVFNRLSSCGSTKGISPKTGTLCVRGRIDKRLFEPFCVWILFYWER